MANRSKKTVLSVRVSPYAKACLDVLASIGQKSLPSAIEDLLESAFESIHIAPPAFVKKSALVEIGGKKVVPLGQLMRAVWTENQNLLKLRLHLVEPSALSDRDQVITGTVFKNLELFGGNDEIFDTRATMIDASSPGIPKISLALVNLYWPLISDYARFIASNSINLGFLDYLDMLRKSGDLDPIYDAI